MTNQQLTKRKKLKEKKTMPKTDKLTKQPLTIMDIQTRSMKKLEERKKYLEDTMTNGTVAIHHGDKYGQISDIKIVRSGLFHHQLYFTGILIDTYAKVR